MTSTANENLPIGQRVRRLRKAANYSQAELGASLSLGTNSHITQVMISKTEIGQRPLGLLEAAGLADLLGVRVECVLNDEALETALPAVAEQSSQRKLVVRLKRAKLELAQAEAALALADPQENPR